MPESVEASPIHDSEARDAWRRAKPHRSRCYVCGIPEHHTVWRRAVAGINTHHLVGGPARSDEPANMVQLCSRCHMVVHGERIPLEKGKGHHPPISFGVLLTAKLEFDPEEYDMDRLTVLKRCRHMTQTYRPLGDPEPVPDFYLEEVHSWRS